MNIYPVTDKKTKKDFLDVARIIYKNDKAWVCPLDAEIENVFNPETNQSFKSGDAIRWVLKDENNKLIGRIAAFYDEKKMNVNNRQPTGGIGFFECIKNQQAASLLFDTAKDWLKGKGIEAMDGPINFGENYFFWGLLVEGFMHQAYGMQYNHPYYKELFENYGFKNFFEQYSYHIDLSKPFNERQVRFAEHIAKKPNFSFEHFTFKNRDKYIWDIVNTFNTIWSQFHEGYTPLTFEDIETMVENAKPVMDEEFIWFAYNEGEPIALMVALPDVNQLIKGFKGKLNFVNILRFMYRKITKKVSRSRLLIAGIHPDFQASGILGALFLRYANALKRKKQYKELELSWVGDYNPKMMSIYRHLGGVKAKTHVTYRYLFDQNTPFERFGESEDETSK
jgi:hypothetical protein